MSIISIINKLWLNMKEWTNIPQLTLTEYLNNRSVLILSFYINKLWSIIMEWSFLPFVLKWESPFSESIRKLRATIYPKFKPLCSLLYSLTSFLVLQTPNTGQIILFHVFAWFCKILNEKKRSKRAYFCLIPVQHPW